ncbi:PaaI family thioesterase [Henriciella sp. AS95]|uniref:PaaI family thioesterase n=1 Tax=Henriciella sp. AS95 TaxID=3135782 RepID=UPI00316B7FE7
MTDMEIPAGFAPHFKKSGFTDPWEPLYSKRADRKLLMGLHVAKAHCNSRGFAHGGLIAALADNSMGLSTGEVLKAENRTDIAGLVTVSLNTDFIGSARIGQWLEVDTHFVKTGGSICFTDALVTADGDVVARANATFKILKARKAA